MGKLLVVYSIFLMVTLFGILHSDGACIIGSSCSETEYEISSSCSETEYEINEIRSDPSSREGLLQRIEDIILNLKEKVRYVEFPESPTRGVEQEECQCTHYSCGCCAHLEEDDFHLNSTICANATYLSEDIGISLTISVNNCIIYNKTVSVRNPPPVCVGLPFVKKLAEACVQLYDVEATTSRLHACFRVEARMYNVHVAKYELGCFSLGPQVADEFTYNVLGNAETFYSSSSAMHFWSAIHILTICYCLGRNINIALTLD